jgi:serine/threonine protein kinase
MLRLNPGDDKLISLLGATIPSVHQEGADYRIEAPLGFGSVAVAFYGLRRTPEGSAPVVLKLLRPSFVRQFAPIARLTIEREVIALRRLNEQVPPNPFVVRLLDDGTVPVLVRGEKVDLPWIAIEYVHGGAHGTTLAQRVENAIAATGHAFTPARAMHALEHITLALEAVQEVGVIHRGLSPSNVLCSGFADDEVFKIADFGVARSSIAPPPPPGAPLGLPGYTAPELVEGSPDDAGPWSDTFSLGALVYFMLTGEWYFPTHRMDAALAAIRQPERRSIRDAKALCPELRERESACRSIDFILGWATAADPQNRIAEVHGLSAMLAPNLRSESMRPSFALSAEPAFDAGARAELWTFRTLRRPGSVGVLRSVAWDTSGGCLAATTEGLYAWDGTRWAAANVAGVPDPRALRFVRRLAPGRWIIGGDGSMLAIYTTGGVTRLVKAPAEAARFEQLSGNLEDIAVLVSTPSSGTPTLNTFIGRRWLKPYPLPEVAALAGLAQVDDDKWLLAGRTTDSKSFAALFCSLDLTLERLAAPDRGAFTACSGHARLGAGLAVGSKGRLLWRDASGTEVESIDGEPTLSAARIDESGRGWTASAGGVWLRAADAGAVGSAWQCLYHEADAIAPVVSLWAEEGRVLAITADGAILEGTSELDEDARASSRRFG